MEWPKILLVIGVAMALLYFAPHLTLALTGIVGMVIGAMCTLFVYGDARARDMDRSAVLLWTGLVGFTTFFMCQYSLLAFLLYVIATRGSRW